MAANRGSTQGPAGKKIMDQPELFKRFKYIRFKEFRAPEGRAAWPERSVMFAFARQRRDFVDLY